MDNRRTKRKSWDHESLEQQLTIQQQLESVNKYPASVSKGRSPTREIETNNLMHSKQQVKGRSQKSELASSTSVSVPKVQSDKFSAKSAQFIQKIIFQSEDLQQQSQSQHYQSQTKGMLSTSQSQKGKLYLKPLGQSRYPAAFNSSSISNNNFVISSSNDNSASQVPIASNITSPKSGSTREQQQQQPILILNNNSSSDTKRFKSLGELLDQKPINRLRPQQLKDNIPEYPNNNSPIKSRGVLFSPNQSSSTLKRNYSNQQLFHSSKNQQFSPDERVNIQQKFTPLFEGIQKSKRQVWKNDSSSNLQLNISASTTAGVSFSGTAAVAANQTIQQITSPISQRLIGVNAAAFAAVNSSTTSRSSKSKAPFLFSQTLVAQGATNRGGGFHPDDSLGSFFPNMSNNNSSKKIIPQKRNNELLVSESNNQLLTFITPTSATAQQIIMPGESFTSPKSKDAQTNHSYAPKFFSKQQRDNSEARSTGQVYSQQQQGLLMQPKDELAQYIQKFVKLNPEMSNQKDKLLRIQLLRKKQIEINKSIQERNFEETIGHMKEILAITAQEKHLEGFAETIIQIGCLYQFNHDLDNAIYAFSQLKYLSELVRDARLKMKSFELLGQLMQDESQYELSMSLLRRAIHYAWYLNDESAESDLYDKLGFLYFMQGDVEKAKYFHSRSIQHETESLRSENRQQSVNQIAKQFDIPPTSGPAMPSSSTINAASAMTTSMDRNGNTFSINNHSMLASQNNNNNNGNNNSNSNQNSVPHHTLNPMVLAKLGVLTDSNSELKFSTRISADLQIQMMKDDKELNLAKHDPSEINPESVKLQRAVPEGMENDRDYIVIQRILDSKLTFQPIAQRNTMYKDPFAQKIVDPSLLKMSLEDKVKKVQLEVFDDTRLQKKLKQAQVTALINRSNQSQAHFYNHCSPNRNLLGFKYTFKPSSLKLKAYFQKLEDMIKSSDSQH